MDRLICARSERNRGVVTAHELSAESGSRRPCCLPDQRLAPYDDSSGVFVHPRELSDNPRLNAFCRVAPSLRLRLLAIFLAGVLLRAADFNSRTSALVQARLFEFLLAMNGSPNRKLRLYLEVLPNESFRQQMIGSVGSKSIRRAEPRKLHSNPRNQRAVFPPRSSTGTMWLKAAR